MSQSRSTVKGRPATTRPEECTVRLICMLAILDQVTGDIINKVLGDLKCDL